MLAAPIRRLGAVALDGSLSLALEVCGPEPPNESIAADHYRAWYPVRASVRTRRTLSTFLECIRIALEQSLEASERRNDARYASAECEAEGAQTSLVTRTSTDAC